MFPTLSEIKEKTKKVYANAFKDTHKKIVYIPYKVPPKDLVKEINKDIKL